MQYWGHTYTKNVYIYCVPEIQIFVWDILMLRNHFSETQI